MSFNIQKIFDHFDDDKNGYIDRHELDILFEALRELEPHLNIDVTKASYYFKLADFNNDNQLSYNELCFLLCQVLYAGDPSLPQIKGLFDQLDSDKDSLLNKSQFAQFLAKNYGFLSGQQMPFLDSVFVDFFGNIGTQTDVKISAEEFFLYAKGALR